MNKVELLVLQAGLPQVLQRQKMHESHGLRTRRLASASRALRTDDVAAVPLRGSQTSHRGGRNTDNYKTSDMPLTAGTHEGRRWEPRSEPEARDGFLERATWSSVLKVTTRLAK